MAGDPFLITLDLLLMRFVSGSKFPLFMSFWGEGAGPLV